MSLRTASLLAVLFVSFVPLAARAQTTDRPIITAPDSFEMQALSPLIDRGAVIVTHPTRYGETMFCTIYVRAHAPIDTVARVIATPEEYPRFVPALSDVDVRGRHAGRAAFRLRANFGVFDVVADATLHQISPRRIDFAVETSELGPGGARWDLYPEGDAQTLVAMTVWTDPTQGNWAVRQAAPAGTYAPWSASISIETVLALGVTRRAEILSGRTLPVRPASAMAARQPLQPLPMGAWLQLTRDTNIVVLTLDAQGAVEEVSAAGASIYPLDVLTRRILDVGAWHEGWPWIRSADVIDRSPGRVHYRLALGSPMAHSTGELENVLEPNGQSVRVEGRTGDFAGEDCRWDFVHFADLSYMVYTSRLPLSHAPWTERTVLQSDPWLAAGLSAFWQIVTIRSAFANAH